MSETTPTSSKKKAPKKPKMPDIRAHIAGMAHKRNYTLTKMSRAMGRNSNYLHQALSKGDPRIGLLMQLSEMLHHNLLEPYLALMPPTIGPTAAERDLIQQLAAKTAELETVKAERDRLWGVVEKRMG
jgi:hypothetical protein